METVNQLLQLFPYAIMGSILAGMICGFLGTFVVSQRVVFLGATLTQVSVAGVAFSFLHLVNVEGIISSLLEITITEQVDGELESAHSPPAATLTVLFLEVRSRIQGSQSPIS